MPSAHFEDVPVFGKHIECHDVNEFKPFAYISGSMDTGFLFMVRYNMEYYPARSSTPYWYRITDQDQDAVDCQKRKRKKKKKEKAHPKCRKPEGGSVQRPDKLLTGLLGLSPENGALCDAIRTRTKYGITSVQSNLSIAYTASTSLQETCRLQNEDNPVYSSSVEKKGVVIGYTTD